MLEQEGGEPELGKWIVFLFKNSCRFGLSTKYNTKLMGSVDVQLNWLNSRQRSASPPNAGFFTGGTQGGAKHCSLLLLCHSFMSHALADPQCGSGSIASVS